MLIPQQQEYAAKIFCQKTSWFLPFQKGIIQSNNALRLLYNDLKANFDIEFLLTYRPNQYVLENFFGVIRDKGGINVHPDRLQFKYRTFSDATKMDEDVLSNSANVSDDDVPDFDMIPHTLTDSSLKGIPETVGNTEWGDCKKDLQLDGLEYDGLENLSGYICHQLKKNVNNLAKKIGNERKQLKVKLP